MVNVYFMTKQGLCCQQAILVLLPKGTTTIEPNKCIRSVFLSLVVLLSACLISRNTLRPQVPCSSYRMLARAPRDPFVPKEAGARKSAFKIQCSALPQTDCLPGAIKNSALMAQFPEM
jgi:hypothetical protein